MRLFFLCLYLSCQFDLIGQDTLKVTKQQGFLFLSEHNYMYDKSTHEIKLLGFHDFFFPSLFFDKKCILDSNLNITFKNGLRVDFFNGRNGIKSRSQPIPGLDTSNCYKYDKFYVIPVLIDYKIFGDYEPFVCRRPYYAVKVKNGSSLRFEYLHKAISITRIKVLSDF